jgi:hypothetical protein
MTTPRKPTTEELQQLIAFDRERFAYGNDEEAAEVVDAAFIAVFDDYVTGGPGWAGKLMMVVYDGSPSQYEVFIWDDTQLRRVDQEPNE